ncbi:MAG: hypothetical protein AB7O97_16880, partial [Planctomycetota bacterium]
MPNEAELAVLDAALEEEFGAVQAPDLWPRLQAATAGVAAPAAVPRARGRHGRLAAAAILLLGVALVVGVLWSRAAGERDERATAIDPTVGLGTDPDGPRSLAELREWLDVRGLRGGSVRALVAPVPGGLLDGRSDPGSVRLHTVGMDPAAVPVV